MSTPTFFIHTLGCKVNRAESETLAAALLELGWMPAADARATLAVLSTCTVTGEADAKNRKVLRALLRQGPQHIIVTGCAVNMDADAYASLDGRIVCVASKAKLPEVAQRLVSQQEAGDGEPQAGADVCAAQGDGAGHGFASVGGPGMGANACAVQGDAATHGFAPAGGSRAGGNARDAQEGGAARGFGGSERPGTGANARAAQGNGAERGFAPAEKPHAAPNPRVARETAAELGFAPGNSPTTRPLFRTRVDVKIQDGCDNACSYCIVHAARGPARSEPADGVVERVAQLAASGTQEVVLVGIDIGAYRDGALDLAGLLQRLLAETGIGRIRISSIEPHSLTPPLIDVLAHAGGRVCRHLHVCLQSGSSNVLRQMNRGYSAEAFAELVGAARAQVEGLALSTDVIVGFPGETDGDFERTCQLVRECGFMRLHVFRYSKRPGTPAAERADQVPPQVMAARAARLRELGAALAMRDAKGRIGRVEQVIVERPGRGTAESYHGVAFAADAPQGSLLPMRLTAYDEQRGLLIAEPC